MVHWHYEPKKRLGSPTELDGSVSETMDIVDAIDVDMF